MPTACLLRGFLLPVLRAAASGHITTHIMRLGSLFAAILVSLLVPRRAHALTPVHVADLPSGNSVCSAGTAGSNLVVTYREASLPGGSFDGTQVVAFDALGTMTPLMAKLPFATSGECQEVVEASGWSALVLGRPTPSRTFGGYSLFATDGTALGTNKLADVPLEAKGFSQPLGSDALLLGAVYTRTGARPMPPLSFPAVRWACGDRLYALERRADPLSGTNGLIHELDAAGNDRGVQAWGGLLGEDPWNSFYGAACLGGEFFTYTFDRKVRDPSGRIENEGEQAWYAPANAPAVRLPAPVNARAGNVFLRHSRDAEVASLESVTPSGTTRLRQWTASPGRIPSVTRAFSTATHFFFRVERTANPVEDGLWASDGSPSGTALLIRGHDYATHAAQSSFVAVDGRVYFLLVASSAGPTELWQSDGTIPGTAKVATLPADPGQVAWAAAGLRVVGSRLYYFVQPDPSAATALWMIETHPDENGSSPGVSGTAGSAAGSRPASPDAGVHQSPPPQTPPSASAPSASPDVGASSSSGASGAEPGCTISIPTSRWNWSPLVALAGVAGLRWRRRTAARGARFSSR